MEDSSGHRSFVFAYDSARRATTRMECRGVSILERAADGVCRSLCCWANAVGLTHSRPGSTRRHRLSNSLSALRVTANIEHFCRLTQVKPSAWASENTCDANCCWNSDSDTHAVFLNPSVPRFVDG